MLSNPTFGAETYIILSHFSDLPNKLQRHFLRSAECLELCKLHNLVLGEILGLLGLIITLHCITVHLHSYGKQLDTSEQICLKLNVMVCVKKIRKYSNQIYL